MRLGGHSEEKANMYRVGEIEFFSSTCVTEYWEVKLGLYTVAVHGHDAYFHCIGPSAWDG